MIVTVGVIDQRALSKLPFETIRIEFRLLLTNARITPGALGLHEGEWLTVVAPEDVVDKSLTWGVRHSAHFKLAITGLVERPAGLLEQEVDEVIASLGL